MQDLTSLLLPYPCQDNVDLQETEKRHKAKEFHSYDFESGMEQSVHILMYCCIEANVFNQEVDDTNHVAGSGLNVIQRSPAPKNINTTVMSTEILNPTKIIKKQISST